MRPQRNKVNSLAGKRFSISTLLLLSGILAYAQPPSHDPSTMIAGGGRYWIFTTGDGVWCMSSSNTNFSDWRAEPTPYTKTSWPSWIKTYVPNFAGTFWAPEVINYNGEYRMYYSCSTFGSKNSCIGLATASSLSGPWTDKGVVVYSNSGTSENAIDAAIYAGSYLVYGSFFGGIRLAEISSTGKPRNSTRYALASGDAEAPYIIKNGSYYYLFINRGSCCQGANSTTYRIQVGRSTSITGPYLDKTGKNLNSGGGSDVVKTTGRYIGPGHFGYGNGKVTYHFYDGNDNGNAKLRVTTLSWSNGWPVISGGGARLSEGEDLAIEASEVINLYPNPTRNKLVQVSAYLKEDSHLRIKIYDLAGAEVFIQDLGVVSSGEFKSELDVTSLVTGQYVVRFERAGLGTLTRRLSIE